MTPNIPVSVWEQLGVVIVFSFLLAGLGLSGLQAMVRVSQNLTQRQVELIKSCLEECRAIWQQIIEYFESTARIDQEILENLEQLRQQQEKLSAAFEAHTHTPARRGRKAGGRNE